MRPERLLTALLATLVIIVVPASDLWAGSGYRVLHHFGAKNDGAGLWGSLALDRWGNLYGTTSGGGAYEYGTVFQLAPRTNGKWTETVLRSFRINDPNGDDLNGSLILDKAGNLYGTTTFGGAHGYGTVFEMMRGLNHWSEKVLYSFPQISINHGCCPASGLVRDKRGNLYGTAGSPFLLKPGQDSWSEVLLHSFTCHHGDGCVDLAGVVLDAAGNVYGTTEHGGTSKNCGGGCGTAFELLHMPDGRWKEIILHSFGSQGDGAFPGFGDSLIVDTSGSVYGTTDIGGPGGYGTVFKLTSSSDGHWEETILHSFTLGSDGDHVAAGVVMDKTGNLYGTTIGGGAQCECGVIYKLAPGSGGKWAYTVLHRFSGYDGAEPDANLIFDDKGNLYGTTATGGAHGGGVVFEITP